MYTEFGGLQEGLVPVASHSKVKMGCKPCQGQPTVKCESLSILIQTQIFLGGNDALIMTVQCTKWLCVEV